MKVFLWFIFGIFISCNQTNKLKPTIGRDIVFDRNLSASDIPYFIISNLNLNKIKFCSVEIDKKDISIINQEPLQLLNSEKLSFNKKVLISFNKLQELSLANWQTCQSVILEGYFGNFIKDFGHITLSIEKEKNKQQVFSKEFISKDNNPLTQKINFEIKNQKEFVEQLLIYGNLNLVYTNEEKITNQSNSYFLYDDLIFEKMNENLRTKEFGSVCYYDKCGRFLEMETFLWLEEREDELLWVKYKNKYFYGKYEDILKKLSTINLFSVPNIVGKEFKNPISIETFFYGSINKGNIEQLTNRISTGWIVETCHHVREINRREKINKVQECYERQVSGEIVYRVAQITSFKEIKLNSDFITILFPQFNSMEKCFKSSGESISLKCNLLKNDQSLLNQEKFVFPHLTSPVEMVTVGPMSIISNVGEGKPGFHLNYPLPSVEKINVYRDLNLKGWATVLELSSVLTEEFYRN